jgi:hypothetical protein
MKGQERERSFLNGNRVYRGTSHAPDSGRKDPTGYIQRGIKKEQSDSRSGLAAAALNLRDRINGNQQQSMPPPVIPQPLVPVGPGLMKDRRGRIYNAGNQTQAPQAAQEPRPA